MSAYTRNAIYSKVAGAVINAHSGVLCTSTYNQIPPQLPCVFCREVGHYTPTEAVNLAYNEDIYRCAFEVQIFSNAAGGAQTEAYNILATIKSAFRSMCFTETMESPVDNADENIYRLTARFERVICGGDGMPTPPSPPPPPPTYTIMLRGLGSEDYCCMWLASDPDTVYDSESQGQMGEVEVQDGDAIVCYVYGEQTQAVTLDGVTQTLVDNKCSITPTSDLVLEFNFNPEEGLAVIEITTVNE